MTGSGDTSIATKHVELSVLRMSLSYPDVAANTFQIRSIANQEAEGAEERRSRFRREQGENLCGRGDNGRWNNWGGRSSWITVWMNVQYTTNIGKAENRRNVLEGGRQSRTRRPRSKGVRIGSRPWTGRAVASF